MSQAVPRPSEREPFPLLVLQGALAGTALAVTPWLACRFDPFGPFVFEPVKVALLAHIAATLGGNDGPGTVAWLARLSPGLFLFARRLSRDVHARGPMQATALARGVAVASGALIQVAGKAARVISARAHLHAGQSQCLRRLSPRAVAARRDSREPESEQIMKLRKKPAQRAR